ncbi:MAG: hypothetical protein E6J45_01360 [Chloroflexi bacterium]|nr:MAG: hypothetical protein E6J45_01360 [Chloroflexota bacterium]
MKGMLAVVIALTLGTAAGMTAHAAALSLEGVPHYQHVGILVLENESFTSTWGAGSPATYLNSLVPQGAFADQYFADGHVSLDNYVSMTSAQSENALTNTDCAAVNFFQCSQSVGVIGGGANIGDQLDTAGLSWKGYMDSMPSACFHADDSPTAIPPDPYQGDSTTPPAGNYADRHNPFIYYPDIETNNTRCQAHDVPYTDLATNLAANTLPAYFFITPDTCHDGHDAPCAGGEPGGLVSFDAWLQANLPALLSYLSSNDGVVFITADEGSSTDSAGCCTGGPGGGPGFGGRVGLLALGAGVAVGTTTHTSYDHASLLRTTEDATGISTYLNNAGTATAMSDLFAPAADTPETPLTLALPLAGAAALAVALVRRRRRAQTP